MSNETWKFLQNTFEIQMRTSNKKMLTLTTDTDSKLAAEAPGDPDIQAIYDEYHPIHTTYVDIYQNYQVVFGERKGKTLNLETLMSETLPLELRKWEAAVRNVYPEDTPQEVEIFPNKRTPFINGTYEQRIAAVGALADKLATIPAFATLTTQVQSFHNVLLTARDTQQQSEGSKGQLSDVRENQRVINADALYGIVLGELMKKYRSDRDQIARFFDLSLIRSNGTDIPPTTIIIKGKVTNAQTTAPIIGAPVFISVPGEPTGLSENTDANGNYEFVIEDLPPDAAGTASVNVTVVGYHAFTQNIEVEVGNSYTVDMVLQPMAPPLP